jgi:hypothetical protein
MRLIGLAVILAVRLTLVPLAQMLAVLEAVIGQFYVAVVIAWLVSAYAARHRLGA